MLDIYKASAGSGKTYTLTLEYIKMLLGRRDADGMYHFYDNILSPHRHILAVTFTNKATDEMKQRIVKQLDLLAHDIDRSPYRLTLCEAFGCDATRLQQTARTVLYQLLHDFSAFNVSTIDSFFQQVLRALTLELGLQGGYDVEMDNAYVTATAIDRMLDDLDETQDKALFEWLTQYAEESIREGGSWDIYGRNSGQSDIQDLAKELASETYKRYRPQLLKEHDGGNRFGQYLACIRSVRDDFRRTLRTYATAALDAIEATGIDTDDFLYKWPRRIELLADTKNPVTYDELKKLTAYASQPEKWIGKTKIKKLGIDMDAVTASLSGPLQALTSYIDEHAVDYYTAIESMRHFYALGILTDIDKRIEEYEQEHNTLLLSNTSEILSGIINGSDAPFIYEKLGTRIEHYLIDEFQDTSRMQWQNFAPLVEESLANGNDNLIVGDVKQSIYRWRNSDWRLLHAAFDSRSNPQYVHHNMDTNWRSCAGVVKFNNAFFNAAATLVQQHLTEEIRKSALREDERPTPEVAAAYAHLEQKVAAANEAQSGYVAIHLLKNAKNKGEFREQVNERIVEQLTHLLEAGYRMRDIAFLVSTNNEAKDIVERLLALSIESEGPLHDIKVISDEALLITNAPPVKLIMGILKHINRPDTCIYELFLAYEHELMRLAMRHGESRALAAYIEQRHNGNGISGELQAFIESIQGLPLFEMCERIISYFSRFGYTDRYVAYIEAFQDIVADYCRTHNADLHSFLAWWDAKEERSRERADSSFSIKSPDDIDAIRVLTIHKAKGLEFPVVIIPYATWDLNREDKRGRRTYLWCAPHEEPFDRMPVLPLSYSGKKLACTHFARDYFEECICSHIDTLNLAYVAFTRAVERLIVFSQYHCSEHSPGTMSDLLTLVLTDDGIAYDDGSTLHSHCTEIDDDADCNCELCFETGNGSLPAGREDRRSEKELQETSYGIVPPGDRMRLRLKSSGITGNDARDYGTLMHNLLADIRYHDDIAPTVQQYVRQGMLPAAEAAATTARLQQWLSQPETRQWYAPGITVLTETEILQPRSAFYRPDRVVIDKGKVTIIDYKFGNIERDATYRKQLANYMGLVRQMGYDEVCGYIWYLSLERIVQV